MPPITYRSELTAEQFLRVAQAVWPRDWYDATRIQAALTRTINIGAFDEERPVGCVRVLTDGYLFATVPEVLVHPDYQRQGIGRRLMAMALEHSPRGILFFGAQPQSAPFFERIGCVRGPEGFVLRTPALRM